MSSGVLGERTLMHHGSLPPLPVPELEQTCRKYLLSVKPFLNDDEYRYTEFVVDTFRTGAGKVLHQKLKERAQTKKNWLAEWWSDIYLAYRGPLPFFSNFGGMTDYTDFWKPEHGTQIKRLSYFLHLVLQKHLKIQREDWPVTKLKRKFPMDMQLYYNLFASARMPGVEKDQLLHYSIKDGVPLWEMRHVVVIRRKRFFVFDALTEDFEVLNPPEIELQLQRICDVADSLPDAPAVGSLTSTDRGTWKKVQDYMIALDAENLEIIDTINKSLLVCVIEEAEPATLNEIGSECIVGDSGHRWYDKGLQLMSFRNGRIGGNADASMECMVGDTQNRWFDKGCQIIGFQTGILGNQCDHAHIDGFMVSDIFEDINTDLCKTKGKWMGATEIRILARPIELRFHVDDYIKREIEIALSKHNAMRKNAYSIDEPVKNIGKQFAKDVSVHPDSFLQMASQLAYYRLHKRCVPTYESATTRQFQDGRTETLRVCTIESKRFVAAMDDDKCSISTKIRLLRDACGLHSKMMDECCNGQGIDRHLLGMRIIAEQEGFDVPMIFIDKAWKRSGGDASFVLSTSLSGYRSAHGGLGPMTLDGYGVFYTMDNDKIYLVVSSYGNETTDCYKFYDKIVESLHDMKKLLINAKM